MAYPRDIVPLTADFVSAAAIAASPITGLSMQVTGGWTYHLFGTLMSTVAATTTGVNYGISASNPTTAPTIIGFLLWTADAVGTIDGGGVNTYTTTGGTTGMVTAALTSSSTGGHITMFSAIVTPSVTQNLNIEVAPEAAAAVTVRAGSFFEWKRVN